MGGLRVITDGGLFSLSPFTNHKWSECMKPLKFIWSITPAVIIGKKIHQAHIKSKQAKQAEKQARPLKPLSLGGAYYSSHPEIHGCNSLLLEFRVDGVVAYDTWNHKRNERFIAKKFEWSEIAGFDFQSEDKTNIQTSQRITATRMAAGGVFALAAPKTKRSGNVKEKFYDVLHTTTGDIELESQIDSGGAGGSIGDLSRSMTRIAIGRREANSKNIKRFIAEHAAAKLPAHGEAHDPAEQVRKLAQLKDEGHLTQQEFDSKKKQLLGL